MKVKTIKQELGKLANQTQAKILQRFFKTGPGQYGAGDKFLGIKVPQQRAIAKKYYQTVALSEITDLIKSPYHEHRLTGLIILVMKFPQATEIGQKQIFDFYLKNTKRINNWDLVDLTTPNIVGTWLLTHERKILYQLAKSKLLWDRRIAILTTFTFIRAKQFNDAIKISEMLLTDKHDLIHKAIGWMLREIGKRDKKELIKFLEKNYAKMPRTMLRYAIEKLPKKQRKYYLNK
ncbi:MAG: DNA alkylation repair protein [Candidatus Magasanikbacteria bacterium]